MHVLLPSHLCVPLCCRLKLGAVIKLYWICKGSAFVILKVRQSCCFVLENGDILIDMGDRWLWMFPEVSLCYCEIQSAFCAKANNLGNVHAYFILMDPCIVFQSFFRAAHRSLSGALNFISSLWFICPYGYRSLPRLSGHCSAHSTLATAGHHMGIWTRGCKYSLELLTVSGVPLETCWAFNP